MTERSRWAFPRLARVAVAWVAAVVLGSSALAAQGTTGKIEGTVRDQSGAPINGAQVFIVGTAYSAASNERGYYFINNVPAGVMVVRAQYIGYQPSEVRNVRVFAGQTMTVNAVMEQRAIEVSAVTVTVEQTPIVPRDQVTSKPIVQGDVIQAMPIDNVQEILRLQPGVVEGRTGQTIRGGRPTETATYIDGVLVRSLTASQAVTVGTNAIEEASVTTGAMGAEYGEAQSGVVNMVTRAGGQSLRGSVTYMTDDPAGETYGTGLNRIEASLSGPIARNLTFFVATTLSGQQNAQRSKLAADLPYYVLDGISDSVLVAMDTTPTADSQMVYLPAFSRYSTGSRRPLQWNDNMTFDGKLQYTFGTGSRVSLTAHRTVAQGLNWPGAGALYNPSSQRGNWNLSDAWILNWTQNLAQSSERALFLEAVFSYQHDQNINPGLINPEWVNAHRSPFMSFTFSKPDFVTSFENFPIDEALLQNIRLGTCRSGRDAARPDMGGCIPFIDRTDLNAAADYRLNPYGVTAGATYLPNSGITSLGGPTLNEETRYTGRVNFDWQAGRYNRVRFGGDFVKTDMAHFTSGMVTQIFMDAYIDHPLRYGLYVSDRIDLGDVVVDMGLRYDRLDSKVKYPRSPGRVFTDPIREGELRTAFTAEDTAMAQRCVAASDANDLAALAVCNYFTAPARGALAPSLRVSFPVTDRTGFRLSYAHQLQSPAFNLLATGVNADLAYTNTNNTFGRDLTFGKTILFEFGVRHAFSDDMVLDIAAYNKDKMSDITARTLPVLDPNDSAMQMVNMLTNMDFGNVRGLDIRLDRRIGQLFQGTIAYTYQTAMTTGSDPNEYLRTFARQISSVTGERVQAPQALLVSAENRVHTVAGNLALNFPSGWRSGTTIGKVLENFGFNATFRFNSGLPYTRLINVGAGTTYPGGGFGSSYTGAERLNGATMPWQKNVDLRVTRGLRLAGRDLTLFADFRNLFDWSNVTLIWGETGDVVNDLFRTNTITPVIESLRGEADNRWETRAVVVNGVPQNLEGAVVGTERADCDLWAPNESYGKPNCLMLQRTERTYGNGDGFFDSLEQDRAFGAWYDTNNGSWAFYGNGLNIRFGFELNF